MALQRCCVFLSSILCSNGVKKTCISCLHTHISLSFVFLIDTVNQLNAYLLVAMLGQKKKLLLETGDVLAPGALCWGLEVLCLGLLILSLGAAVLHLIILLLLYYY